MPPIRAASARLIPSSTAASDSRRRLWLACLEAAASRRSSSVEKSASPSPLSPWHESSRAMESAQHREGNRQRVRTEGRWYKAAVRRVGPPRTERSNNDYPNRSLSSLPGNHTEIENAANRVHFFPFVRQGIRHPR